MSFQFVDVNGKSWNPSAAATTPVKRTKRDAPESFHNGWRVVGIPPGALEAAQADHARESLATRENGKQPKEWNQDHWLMNAKRKAVRSRPYEVPEAAAECKRMATAAGWLCVEVLELKKDGKQ